ncbi:MAG: nucleoside 2-deoxyribosyltransferase [Calditrichaeota bacterium]|nr:MAG: nucleoside 2-deoxyribosyltransferase [Calditrichota bacterium]
MQIYFAASIRGGRQNQKLYAEVIAFLQTKAHVLTEHIGAAELSQTGEAGLSDATIFERDIAMLGQADAVIAEVTTPSLGVGYELGRAEMIGKPVLCLFNKQNPNMLSAMLAGNEKFTVHYYSGLEEIKAAISDFIQKIEMTSKI